MGSNDYENIDGWRPILLESPTTGQLVRDPWVSWWEHRQRGSLGGVDCAAVEGTEIRMPADGYVSHIQVENGGSGGRTATVLYNNGFKDQFMHLQQFVGSAGSRPKGSVFALTGRSVAPGYSPVAQHLHWHRIDPNGYYSDPYGVTNRRNPWSYFVGSGTAGGGTIPIEDDMYTDDDRNKAVSVWKAVYTGGGDAGNKSIIQRLIDLETRVYNIDTQVTGAAPFDPAQSVAGRVIKIQNKLGA